MEKVSARAENLIPVSETELAFLARANGLEKSAKKSMYWKRNVSPGWKGNVSIRNEVVYFSALLKFVM